MNFPFGETVTVRRAPAGTNQYGDTVQANWAGAVVDTVVNGVAVWPLTSAEDNTTGRTSVIVGLTFVFPTGTDVVAADRLVWKGVEYQVDGQPFDWRSPFTGWKPGVQVAAKLVAG